MLFFLAFRSLKLFVFVYFYHFVMDFAGAKSKHLVSSGGELSGPSTKALELFEKGSMAEVRLALDR